jgi:hypothetical protein
LPSAKFPTHASNGGFPARIALAVIAGIEVIGPIKNFGGSVASAGFENLYLRSHWL